MALSQASYSASVGAQRLHLAQLAAAIGIRRPTAPALQARLLVHRLGGRTARIVTPYLVLEPPPQFVGLGEQQARIEREEIDRQPRRAANR